MSQTNNIQNNSAFIALLQQEAKQLLEQLIATPSFSKEEDKSADLIQTYLNQKKLNQNVKKIIYGQSMRIMMHQSQRYY